ncbi:hypothetical protein D0Z00_004033 [Geotrichum galactomycetum]|uniref:Uncharacterized protein n=1 Tax=Geotrichum galactomycetum TaxID=27317 RepID=A0ACB6UZJ7_9ASCO|nr:hypothetical protein D0Z00_004033 [Geotrichum candidum]
MKLSKIILSITGAVLCAADVIPITNDKTNEPVAESISNFGGAEAPPQHPIREFWDVTLGPEIYENVAKPAWLKEWSEIEYSTSHPFKYDLTKIVAGANLTETAMRWAYVVMAGSIYVDLSSKETARYKEEEANETEMKYLWATGLTYEDWCFDRLDPLCKTLQKQNDNPLPDACVIKNQRDAVFTFIDILHRRPEGITEATSQEFINYLFTYKAKP